MMDVTYTGIKPWQERLVLAREISKVKGADLAALEMMGKNSEG